MRPLAIGRIVGLLIALAGIGLAISFARESLRANADFHAWLTAQPLHASIDVSKPGEITTPFRQTCSISHGEAVFLSVLEDKTANFDLQELLRELTGSITISDSDGNEVRSVSIVAREIRGGLNQGDVCIAEVAGFRNGEYVATIRIENAVPGLAMHEQRIYATYLLCGLEQFPAYVAGAIAIVLGAIGLVAAICVLPGLVHHGIRWPIPPTPSQSGQASPDGQ